jgi:hypothetical protein
MNCGSKQDVIELNGRYNLVRLSGIKHEKLHMALLDDDEFANNPMERFVLMCMHAFMMH